MTEQLALWEPPASPVIDWSEEVACTSCGAVTTRALAQMNHNQEPDGRWCISKTLRRNHVISYARAIATAGEWPGRKGTGPAKGWTVEKGYANLREAIELAKDRGVTDQHITEILASEGVTLP
jgi:hypothetical protein